MIQTRAYRVIGVIVNIAGIVALGITAQGPGLGLSTAVIGVILAVANGVVYVGRQILDSSTPTLPTPAPTTLGDVKPPAP